MNLFLTGKERIPCFFPFAIVQSMFGDYVGFSLFFLMIKGYKLYFYFSLFVILIYFFFF